MVRLKTRYILFEVLYPNSKETPLEKHCDSYAASTLALHQKSPSGTTPKQVLRLIRASLKKNFGDYGASMAVGVTVRYFSPETSTGILRVMRANWQHIVCAMTFISKFGTEDCIFNVVEVSGSIKKCQDRAMSRDRQMLLKMQQSTDDDDVVDTIFAQ